MNLPQETNHGQTRKMLILVDDEPFGS